MTSIVPRWVQIILLPFAQIMAVLHGFSEPLRNKLGSPMEIVAPLSTINCIEESLTKESSVAEMFTEEFLIAWCANCHKFSSVVSELLRSYGSES